MWKRTFKGATSSNCHFPANICYRFGAYSRRPKKLPSCNTWPWITNAIADPRIWSWWTETDLWSDALHQSDAPMGLTDLEVLIDYMCPCGLEIDICSFFPPHFWYGNSKESQSLAWADFSVPRKAD